jgi:hypothetical protein
MVYYCSGQCQSQEKMHMPAGVLWFIFNLQIKNKVCYSIHIHTQLLGSLLISTRFILLTYCFVHTWVARRWQHCSKWVHPCSFVKADWVFWLTTWGWTFSSFPPVTWLGCFSLACPDLAADRHADSNSYKSHRYIPRLKQYRCSNRYIHSQLSYILQYTYTNTTDI